MIKHQSIRYITMVTMLLISCILIACSTQPEPPASVPPDLPAPQPEPSTTPPTTTEAEPPSEPVPVVNPPSLILPAERISASHSWMSGSKSEYDLKLSGIGADFTIQDGIHQGWCIEDNFQGNAGKAFLYSSYDEALPDDIKYYRDPSIPKNTIDQPVPWDKLNYLINHKQGDIRDIGAAIFMLMWGKTSSFQLSARAQEMYDDAEENGSGFIPESGQIMAIVLYQDGIGDDKLPDDKDRKYQDTFIEHLIP